MWFAVVALVALGSAIGDEDNRPVLDPAMVEQINSGNFGWKASMSPRFANMTIAQARAMMGARFDYDRSALPVYQADLSLSVPSTFDARSSSSWPQSCIHPIRNQGSCGSCWAFSASETLANRGCIYLHGASVPVLSPQVCASRRELSTLQELVSCDTVSHGCGGGDLPSAWAFMERYGLVTEQCYPYEGANTACPWNGKCPSGAQWYPYRAAAGSTVVLGNPTNIQNSITADGPVSACFTVYADFVHYNGGIYQHTSGNVLGGHCVKIVGWGEENGVPFWTVANSWGTGWGPYGGYFHIRRGVNECGLEHESIVGRA